MKLNLAKIKAIAQPLWLGFLHLAHRLVIPVMILVIIYALLVSSFIALTPWVRTYQQKITHILEQKTKQKVHIGDIKTSWYGLYPVIKLDDLRLAQSNGEIWNCQECWLGIDLIRSLLYWRFYPGMVYIDGVKVEVLHESQNWHIKGLPDIKQAQNISAEVLDGLGVILSFMPEKILIKDMQINIQTASRKPFLLKNIRVLGQKRSGEYHWSAEADLGKKSTLQLRVDMPLLSDLMLPQKGRLYLQTAGLEIKKIPGLQAWLNEKDIQSISGLVEGNAWLDWDKGKITALHSQLILDDLLLQRSKNSQVIKLKHFSANSLWQKQAVGWEIAMDNVHIDNGKDVISNDKFLLFYQPDWDTYHLYLKELPIHFFENFKQILPSPWSSRLAFISDGNIKELQLNIKAGQVDYLLMQFDNVAWPAKANYPGVKGLSGGVSWEPDKTHVELSSPGLEMKFPSMPKMVFDNVHAILGFNTQSTGSQHLEIERLVLSRPDLALTLQGQIDDILVPSKTNARLEMNWSLEHGEHWLPYLPLVLKPGSLLEWLMNDVKTIRQSSGEMVLNGLLKEFPFDAQEGEFSVNSHLYGVDLIFAKNWPLTKQIDANLKVHQRELEATIDRASLNDIPIEALNLRVPFLGQDKEVLLVHGQLSAPITKMLAYLKQSPLKERTKSWAPFDFKGLGHLDLKLDVPLYKGRDDIFVLGHLAFDEQNLDVKLFSNPLFVKQSQGFLDFDGNGVIGGDMQGQVGADPLTLNVDYRPETKDTVFKIKGRVGLDDLKAAWGMNKTDIITGHLPVEGSILLPNGARQYWDMHWQSNMLGVKIDLPRPWSKSAGEIKPLDLEMKLANNGALDIKVLYQQKDFKLNFFNKQWDIFLEEPDIQGHLLYHSEQQKIFAKLSRLYLDGQFIKSQQSTSDKPWAMQDMPNLDIDVEDFRLDGLSLGSVKLQAVQEHKTWQLEQLKLSSPYYDLLIHGRWAQKGSKHHIDVSAQMMISNLAKSLELWHMTPAMDTKQGFLDFQGAWEVSLNHASLKNLEGSLDLRFKKGNITHLDRETEQKIGIGKLLSIASLQTLPRRLQLDFSDLASTGYTYDIFKAHFDLHQGLLKTSNAEMDGPIAYLKMHGGLNILDKWYDLELQVYPYIAASLPVAATIVGGPLAGVATWAASHVINQGMQKVSGYTYKITGPWDKPIVQQMGLMRSH